MVVDVYVRVLSFVNVVWCVSAELCGSGLIA